MQRKLIREAFNDFDGSENILNSQIDNINLYNKTNKLQVNILCNEQVFIDDLDKFETYLVNTFKNKNFKVAKAIVDVKYEDKEFKQNIEENWESIINYITKKEPGSNVFLRNSKVEVDKNVVKIVLPLGGSAFLLSQNFDKGFSHLFKNLYGKNFLVSFEEKISKDLEQELIDKKLEEEEKVIESQREKAKIEIEERKIEKQKEKEKLEIEKKERSEKIKENLKQNNPELAQKIEAFESAESNKENQENSPLILGRSATLKNDLVKIEDIPILENTDMKVTIDGEILTGAIETKDYTDKKSGKEKSIIMFNLFDGTSTIACKAFLDRQKAIDVKKRLSKIKGVVVEGDARYSNYSREVEVMANTILESTGIKEVERIDDAEEKRVELHMHTQMSQLDAITPCEDLIKRAVKWGWNAVAITDHGVVQSFPEAHKYLEKTGSKIKVLYGVEGYFCPDKDPCVSNSKGQSIDTTYCVFDLETTGISHITEKITEIGAIKIKNGKIIDTFESFVNPEKPIPERVVEVTHITDDMVKDAPTIKEIMPKFLEFIGDSVLVAHNADFDIGFMKYNCEELGLHFEETHIDTLRLAKAIFPEFTKYKLGIIAEKLNIVVEVAHRALDDVKTLVEVFKQMLLRAKDRDAKTIDDFDNVFEMDFKKLPVYHIIIIAKNYVGLKNLYKLVSYSHLDYFYRKPRILKSMLNKYREGLIIGSACEQGELYRSIVQEKSDEDLEEIASFYDYLEIQPIGNNEYLIRNGEVENAEVLQSYNRKIVELGEKLGKPVCATCDVHFMDPKDEIYRRILQSGQKYDDADNQAPLYLRTTKEMLKEFEYLGEEKAREVVITNTNKIADMCERIKPISPEKCPPHIPGCEDEIKRITFEKAHSLYGDPLPEIVQERLDKELNSIINNGYSVMYIIAQKLVWKSNEDGYIVGSRGSVGSSLVAFMTGITEVNSLKPHYRCPKCKYSDFTDYGCANGYDLPDKICPNCGEKLEKDGMDIPFETFLGFNGDKEPDIDLNFSGEYQAKAHKYTEVIFGKGTTFKAGTVGTVADKTAFGYAKNYFEEKNIMKSNAEVARLAQGCVGVKRTTGQHPGGIIVVPKGREIYEFTPVQHPADDSGSDIITTHFDYHSIDGNLLKLDILGHDDPTVIRMLQDLTGMKPTDIPLDDKETMSIFNSTDALGVTPEQINSEVGTFGIPEFGTQFARGMLLDTHPTTFDELIRLSGLSHGTDVWLGNAQSLIEEGTVTLKEAICCRDDIMVYLMKRGLPPDKAFKIMETVRKGKALKDPEKWEEFKKIMKDYDIPDWYVKSCEKIKYMFPKAHAAAYVTNAFRIAWFKVHNPLAYYAAYYSIRAKSFDADYMIHGNDIVKRKMKEIENLGNDSTQKDEDMYSDLEIVQEMYQRGFEFLPVDLYKSHSTKFRIEDGKLRPPLNSIAGLGDVAANSIYNEALKEPFECIEDMQARAKIGKSLTEVLEKNGCLKGMTLSNQLSFFIS